MAQQAGSKAAARLLEREIEDKLDAVTTKLDTVITHLIALLGKVQREIHGKDALGEQHVILVDSEGKIIVQSLINVDSTTVPLVGAGTYTSASFGLEGYGKIVGTAFADQPGTLYVEQSQDNVNWDLLSSSPVNANVGAGFQIDVLAPYGRVRYVNLATAQTVFRLYTNVRDI